MPDFLPLLAIGLGIVGAGYLGLALVMGERPEPDAPVIELAASPERLDDDTIVMEWTGDRFEASTPRLDVTV